MTAHDADIEVLRESYGDLIELDRRPEGIRYAAALPDGTPVVVLALTRDLSESVRSAEQFLETLQRAESVRHESLVRPLKWGRASNGLLHCAFPRLDVVDVAPGAPTAAEVATMGEQLARALSVAHDAGIVHGAISTERIQHTRQDGAQLSGFGVFAALCAAGVDCRQASTTLSESAYLSPESQSGTMPDERSDIYSLGASLYELLTGKPPYGGRTTAYVMAAVLSDPESEQDAQDRMTGPVVDALVRAFEQSPDDRWPSAAAFANALAAGAAQSHAGAPSRRSGRGCLPTATAVSLFLVAVLTALVRLTRFE